VISTHMQKIFQTTTGEHILWDEADGVYTLVCEQGLNTLARSLVSVTGDTTLVIDGEEYTVEKGGLLDTL